MLLFARFPVNVTLTQGRRVKVVEQCSVVVGASSL